MEKLRAVVVNAMREGNVCAIYLGDLQFDFKNEWSHPEIFPAATIFDFKEWRKRDTYLKFVKDDEMYCQNDTAHGTFYMSPEFSICLISTSTDLKFVNRITELTPSSDQMEKLVLLETPESTYNNKQVNKPI